MSDIVKPVSFPLCKVTATKQCTGVKINSGNTLTYSFNGTVGNPGSATLYNPTVYDTPPSNTTNLVLNQPSGSIPPNGSVSYTGSMDSSAVLGSGDLNLVSAAASSNSSGQPLNVTCGANPPTQQDNCAAWGDPSQGPCKPTFTPGLTLTKACSVCLSVSGGNAHEQVNESFRLSNSGNLNITGISLLDCEGGTWSNFPSTSPVCSGVQVTIASGVEIDAGGADQTYTHAYTPNYLPDSNGNYVDNAVAFGSLPFNQGPIYDNGGTPVQASCPICPANTKCTFPPI